MLRTADRKLWVGRELSRVARGARGGRTWNLQASGNAAVTSSASANTKGSWTELDASVDFDVDGFYLNILGNTGSRDFLIDIGVGAASSEVVVLSNLLMSSGSVAQNDMMDIYVPLAIPGGSRVSARCQAQLGSSVCNVAFIPVKSRYMTRFGRATTYGADTSVSGGANIDPGGTINTLGAWTQLSAAITNPIRYAIICLGANQNYARTLAGHIAQLGVGGAGSETAIVPGLHFNQNAGLDNFQPHGFERFMEVEAGTRLAARGQASINDATDRLWDMLVIGFDEPLP